MSHTLSPLLQPPFFPLPLPLHFPLSLNPPIYPLFIHSFPQLSSLVPRFLCSSHSPLDIVLTPLNKMKRGRGEFGGIVRYQGGTYRYHIDQGGFSRVLEPHQGQFHLLLPEQAPEPAQDGLQESWERHGGVWREGMGCGWVMQNKKARKTSLCVRPLAPFSGRFFV